MTETIASQRHEFKTELKQLLHIITHSLYSHREIFLRELISNASDAINRIKFDAIAHEDLLEGDQEWKIKIHADKEQGTLTISDNGIGMSLDSIVENLGTIARSGTRVFLENLKQAEAASRPDMIGQFGVGFYSAFMVADKVTVISRPAGDPNQAVKWVSDGQGEYTVEPATRERRGTDVILHLKEDAKEYLEEYTLRRIIKKFSDFLEHPVVMDVEKKEGDETKVVEETVNSQKAIWLRNRSEVTQEEYNEFYKQISHDFQEPAAVIHYKAEGKQEFRVLLFIPKQRPFELRFGGQIEPGPRLYIQRVLIMERCEELLPPYLCFVKGVVDSSDLPLNISRELLQNNPLLEKIRKDIVKSILKELKRMQEDEFDKYSEFFTELGSILKEGVRFEWDNRKQLADLLLYESTKTEPGKYTTLAQYVERMPEDQKEIYYLIGETRSQIEHSPYLEKILAEGKEVLLMTDPMDEIAIPALGKYADKPFKAVDEGTLQAEEVKPDERFQKLIDHLKGKLSEVSDIKLSSRLKESAACLVAGEGGMTAHRERLLHRMGRGADIGEQKRILELNADHEAVKAILGLYEKSPDDSRVEEYARLLYDQAVIAEGSRIKDPAAFARRINDLLVRQAT